MTYITLILLTNGSMEIRQILILTVNDWRIYIDLFHHPLQIFHTVIAGFHAIVTEVLRLTSRILSSTFTPTIPQTRIIAQHLSNLFTELFFLFERIVELRAILITPFNSPLVVIVDTWEESLLADTVFWLCYVVETSIVHDTGSMTILFYPSLVTQFFYWCSKTGTHVMAKTQGVTHLM